MKERATALLIVLMFEGFWENNGGLWEKTILVIGRNPPLVLGLDV